ncbi:hypothetical protein HMPREF9946_01382 [Acetobacteraceae bacterium AT-5844]|nr:hypothetical protein HMPREF9946_01382 [Acetobacteraceae bacterium AT-5844]
MASTRLLCTTDQVRHRIHAGAQLHVGYCCRRDLAKARKMMRWEELVTPLGKARLEMR